MSVLICIPRFEMETIFFSTWNAVGVKFHIIEMNKTIERMERMKKLEKKQWLNDIREDIFIFFATKALRTW